MLVVVKQIEAEETYDIRKEELRKNMSLSHVMAGDDLSDTIHLGVFSNNDLACIGSFMKAVNQQFDGEQYQLRGMATHTSFQGRGYAKMLLEEAESMLKERNVEILWCNARTSALGFYKKLGYKVVGEEFVVDQIGPHFVMYKKL